MSPLPGTAFQDKSTVCLHPFGAGTADVVLARQRLCSSMRFVLAGKASCSKKSQIHLQEGFGRTPRAIYTIEPMGAKRVLFVDDQATERALYSRALQEHSFEVTEASSIIDVLRHIHQHTFDVLIADLKVHEQGDGFKLVRAIREQNPRCVTVILTAYPDFKSAVAGIQYGVDDYQVKTRNRN